MRVAAISDIHGNLPALEAVLAEMDREGVDQIVVVGDTAHGPWPAEVVDLLVEREALCVRGNADREVAERSDRYGPLAPLWHKLAARIFHRGESFYNFQGLRAFKDKFDPEWEPRYVAVQSTWTLPAALLDATALIGGGLRKTLSKN